MPAKKDSERLVWAVETLAVEPDDQVLEIGCGHGGAVSLVAEKLVGGKITAIDRSTVMVEMARKRNHAHLASGRVEILAVSLDRADFSDRRFNKIFAVHVNAFWRQPARDLDIVKPLLSPGGALYLINQPLVATKVPELIERLTRNLQQHGFAVDRVIQKVLEPAPAVCIVARMLIDAREPSPAHPK